MNLQVARRRLPRLRRRARRRLCAALPDLVGRSEGREAQARHRGHAGAQQARLARRRGLEARPGRRRASRISRPSRRSAKTPPLSVQIEQAGLAWTKQTFFVFSAVPAVVAGVGVFVTVAESLIAAAVALLVGGLGVPRWYLKRRKSKRARPLRRGVPQRPRRHRPRRQGGPAARRLPAHHRQRGRRSRSRANSAGRRDAGPRRSAGGRRPAHL